MFATLIVAALPYCYVHELGDPHFRVRQQAEKKILAYGYYACAAVAAGMHDPDLEIRTRCAKLIVKLGQLHPRYYTAPRGKMFWAHMPTVVLPACVALVGRPCTPFWERLLDEDHSKPTRGPAG
jgi:hypothetical protein